MVVVPVPVVIMPKRPAPMSERVERPAMIERCCTGFDPVERTPRVGATTAIRQPHPHEFFANKAISFLTVAITGLSSHDLQDYFA